MQTTAESLEWNRTNGHLVRGGADSYLLHVPTTAVFGLDDMGLAVLEHCRAKGGLSVDELVARLAGIYEPARVRAFAGELRTLEVLQPAGSLRPINPAAVEVRSYPLSTLVLNVNTGCNLSCTYCYKEDLAKPAEGRKMDFVTAARSVDLLLKTGASRERLNVVFFGGEPLTNVPLIQQVTAYAEAEAKRAGKTVDFSLTTNATLLTAELIDSRQKHTAILAFDDLTALGAVRALREAGRSVPGECSVIGFDDILPAAVSSPGITTIHQPMEEMGSIAAAWVMEAVGASEKNGRPAAALRMMRPELIVRESTAAPRDEDPQ